MTAVWWRCLLLVTVFLLPVESKASEWVYVVSKGDSLWDISKTYLGTASSWTKVQKLNQLADPDWVKPGTRLRIPMAWIAQNSVGASVKATYGNCRVVHSDGSEEELLPGDKLSLGDRVQTFAESTVSVEFADRSIVTLDGNSELALDHLSAYGATGMVDSRLRLLKGRLETTVTSANGPGSRFEIHTTAAISAVRGTKYRMAAAEDDGASRVEVTGGIVDVSNSEAKGNVDLNKGFGSVVSAGQLPLPPQALLKAPVLAEIPRSLDRPNWPISWIPVENASKYRVRLADSPSFETVVWQSVTDQSSLRLPTLADGTYHLKVRAIDALGLEGMEREVQFLQAAYPEPPMQLAPANASVSLEKLPPLSWSDSGNANRYRLQIARDAEFTDIVTDQSPIEALEYSQPGSTELGEFYWRVASIESGGNQGPFGPVRNINITAKPPTAQLDSISTNEDMKISWSRTNAKEQYQIQVAHDRKFNRIISNETLTDPEYTLPLTEGKKRYFRIRNVDANGQAGDWSTVQEITALPNDSWKVALGVFLTMVLIAL